MLPHRRAWNVGAVPVDERERLREVAVTLLRDGRVRSRHSEDECHDAEGNLHRGEPNGCGPTRDYPSRDLAEHRRRPEAGDLALVPRVRQSRPSRRRHMGEDEFFQRLAELAVRAGANLQPGQELVVFGDVEHAPLVRATMEAGWRGRASDVQCLYREPYDRLFLGRYAADDRLERSPFATLASFDHL